MSEEFLRAARQEIQDELDMLHKIVLSCADDHQLYQRSNDVERHMHKIKGLAPMMGQEKVGEVARVSDIIVKHVAKHGSLQGSQGIIANAVKMMQLILNSQPGTAVEDFTRQAKTAYPQISGL